jgi:hypothetical protein
MEYYWDIVENNYWQSRTLYTVYGTHQKMDQLIELLNDLRIDSDAMITYQRAEFK